MKYKAFIGGLWFVAACLLGCSEEPAQPMTQAHQTVEKPTKEGLSDQATRNDVIVVNRPRIFFYKGAKIREGVIYISNGHILVQQADGNLVIYSPAGKPLWATNTISPNVAFVAMQEDGNLVMYNLAGRPLWATNTGGQTGAYAIFENGLLRIVKNGLTLWSSR